MENQYFANQEIEKNNDVTIIHDNDFFVKNFGKQWKKYRDIQIDSINNFNISKDFLESLIFGKIKDLKNLSVLEIGCGAGRFTEHLSKETDLCVSVDLSDSIYFNVSKNKLNVKLVKGNFLELKPKKKFDIVFCRGVLQHTQNPFLSILKLYDFVEDNGLVIFDIYSLPKLGFFHPKYFFWRKIIPFLFSYEQFEKILTNKIKVFLKLKRSIDKIFFGKKFFSDCLIPIWDYKNILHLTDENLEKWSILDTLDGLYAKYDKPKSYKSVCEFLKKNNIKILSSSKKRNFFKTKIQ